MMLTVNEGCRHDQHLQKDNRVYEMVLLSHLIHVVTDLMQFSETTCSHVHDVINIIEYTACIQEVTAWTQSSSCKRHKMETKKAFCSQPAHFEP